MLIASLITLVQMETYRTPSYFGPTVLVLLGGGALAWLIAAVLGFSRARAFGPATRWFASSAVCLLIYHLQFLVLAFGAYQNDSDLVLGVGAFFNLFVALGAVCSIIGFLRLTDPD